VAVAVVVVQPLVALEELAVAVLELLVVQQEQVLLTLAAVVVVHMALQPTIVVAAQALSLFGMRSKGE